MKRISKLLYKIVNHIPFTRILVDHIERKNNVMENTLGSLRNGFSFIIVTDGHSIINLKKSILSVMDEFKDMDNYEIIVVGQNNDFPIDNKYIRYVPYHGIWFMPGWITLKKNLGAFLANYDKLVIMHDYISLCEGWLEGYSRFGDNFDVCTNKIIFLDGRRARDWTVYDYPQIGAALLPYDKSSDYIYISGAYFVVKTQFFRHNPLDENRRWGESEDVEWTKRIRKITSIQLNILSCCQFVKNKPPREAPYVDSWIERTIRLYSLFGIEISETNFEQVVKEK